MWYRVHPHAGTDLDPRLYCVGTANLLLEASKLAEMEGKAEDKKAYQTQYETALKRTTELSAAAQKRKEEEEARQAASPPKG